MNSIPEYDLITFGGVYRSDEGYTNELFEEQTEWLRKLGYEDAWDTYATLHHFDSVYSDDWYCGGMRITDGIDALAIKDGADLVRFFNGNVGFVGYYNGYKDAFEILGKE